VTSCFVYIQEQLTYLSTTIVFIILNRPEPSDTAAASADEDDQPGPSRKRIKKEPKIKTETDEKKPNVGKSVFA
jgi:hypothetical protein